MKKSFLLTVLLILTISFSCQEQENSVEPEVNFEEASVFLSDMFSQTIQHSVSNAKFDTNENQLEFTNSDIIGSYLRQNYFPDLEPLKFSFNSQPNARTFEEDNHFSEAQQSFINDFDHAMTNLTSAEEFYSSIEEFRGDVISHTNMSDEQKIEMLAIVEYSYAMHEYLISGGISEIKEVLPGVDNSNSRSARISQQRPNYEVLEYDEEGSGGGCSVNWQGVWTDAVVGFFVGAALGGYVGATTGTFVIPGVLTVTGGVSGAVVGGAVGYVGGATEGVISSLLQTCGR